MPVVDATLMTMELSTTWPVAGHHWASEQLARSIDLRDQAASGVRHAYLFVGPRQIGKSTFVRAFAQAMFCTADGDVKARPCGACRSCQLMSKGVHPDFHLVQPTRRPKESDRNDPLVVDRLGGALRAEQATDIVRSATLRPVESRYKVFHIQDIHLANATFANKLLKTLEEPPPYVVFCLTALDRAGVLPTIISRCQVMELRPLQADIVEQALTEKWRVPPEQAQLLARLANGSLGWAVEQSQNPRGLAQRQEQLEKLWSLMAADRVARLAFAEQAAANRAGVDLFGLLELWAFWLRDVMLAQVGCLESCSNIDHKETVAAQARSLPSQQVQNFMRTLQRVNEMLHHTVNTRLAFDVLVLRLPQLPK